MTVTGGRRSTRTMLSFPFVAIFRVHGGKISSIRIYYDQMELLMQLGLIPARSAG